MLTPQEFYLNCATAALQGLQESNIKCESVAAEMLPQVAARQAFRIADAMLEVANSKHLFESDWAPLLADEDSDPDDEMDEY